MRKEFCVDIEKVENYQIAKEEEFKKWQIHHRLETHTSEGEKRLVPITKAELIALDMYYERPTEELIYLRLAEHTQVHSKGHKVSEAQKIKTSQALKGHGVSKEVREKISRKLKGTTISEETRKKISQTLKGGNKTSFKNGHRNTEEQEKKRIETVKKSMAIKTKIYKEQYKDKMDWNEFQKLYKDGSNTI